MAADPELTALPPCLPPTDATGDATHPAAPQVKRKSTLWRLSRLQPLVQRGHHKEEIIVEEDELVHFKDSADDWEPVSPVSMGAHDDFRKMSDDDSSSMEQSLDEPAEECEDDRCRGPELPIWHCVDCDSSYCSECWMLQGPHKPKKKGRDGVPHEKTDPHIVKQLKTILNPTKNSAQIHRLHEADESTKWFGVTRNSTGQPIFEDYGRYASLMASISPIESMRSRYPQLVSFIGITNAGKSTLIKMLVNHDEQTRIGKSRFPSPVVGSLLNDTVPTSGDVHLYADPATHAEQLPILYADCEGFEGGERTPLGAQARRRLSSDQNKEFSKIGNVHTRKIEWAVTEEHKQREYAVTALYPRLLYTFSDCVVFVLRNPKTFQSAVLTKLLDWGVAALEKSINQPALPHCIVALNGTDPAVDDKEWDTSYATQSLLSSVKGALDIAEGVPRFRELADHWRGLGKDIYTVEDLILRYYSSFKVIRIPSKPRYMLINEQVEKLHGMIKNNCEENFRAKRRARMLSNADELNTYLQSGFDHFTTHLDIPFNFMQISLLRNPIPRDFGGHILQLCTTISRQQLTHEPGRVMWIFERLAIMLASCVLLDCARFRKGRVDELFTNYEKFFDYAISEYLELHYPCAYVSPDGSRHCMLVKARHEPKGHQDEQGIIAAGDYEAAFDSSFTNQWKFQLRAAIHRTQQDFQYELEQLANNDTVEAIPEERLALDLHVDYLSQFFESIGSSSKIISHATCFCCLMDVPEHPLPCGHVLCTACIRAYGKSDKTSTTMLCCPLHRTDTKWSKPAVIRFKPHGAGVRVLCLDGGGIRGIVQLEVLRAIEQILGGYVDIQAFFDLIVGTGTGGMLSVALAIQDRTVDACIDQFKAVCEHAFTPRMKGIPVVSTLAAALGNGRKYKTKPLYAALKTAYGPNEELFGSKSRFRTGSRVALTATSITERESIVLASYRRPEDRNPTYQFERPHEAELELKIWESVAASLASPPYFRPFSFHGKTYLDGGVKTPNPAAIAEKERQLIWPDIDNPDLFLSLGTGQHRMQILQKLSELTPGHTVQAEVERRSGRWKAKKVDDVFDAEIAWLEFRESIGTSKDARARRYIRLNPDLEKEVPASDNKNSLESIQLRVRKNLQLPHRIQALRNVAYRLVASSFYLDLESKSIAEQGEQQCTASICCRFENGSIEMAALGKLLEDRFVDGFQPYFHVRPNVKDLEQAFRIPLTNDIIRAMTDKGVFGLPTVYIPLRDDSKPSTINLFLTAHDGLEPDGYCISNMPRTLLGEKRSAAPRPSRARLESRMKSQQSLRPRNAKSISSTSDQDSISLNGASTDHKNSNSDESWHDVQAKVSAYNQRTGAPKMSLTDILSQPQGGGSSIRGRTNRFWTYIGNNHMTQHPELYSAEEVAKFTSSSQSEQDSSLSSQVESTRPSSVEQTRTSNGRLYVTQSETERASSTYSGQEQFASASPIVQIPIQSSHHKSDQSPIEKAIDSSRPTLLTVNRLDEWLTSQKISGIMPRKSSKLRVVNEDITTEEQALEG